MMKHNVLVITYWSFKDALVQTYTLPYVHIFRELLPPGSVVYVFTREQSHLKMTREEWKKTQREYSSKYNIRLLRAGYRNFGLAAQLQTLFILIRLWLIAVSKGIKTIHTWCTPAGVLGYMLKRFTRKRLVLDSFEPHAEVMLEGGTWEKDSKAFKLLFGFERKMLKKADEIIACTTGMRQYSIEKYGIDRADMLVKPACVDFDKFNTVIVPAQGLLKELGLEGKTIMLYAGKLGGLYLEKEVFEIVKAGAGFFGNSFRFLFLTNTPEEHIQQYCDELQIDRSIIVNRFVPHSEVPQYMALAHFALNPMKPLPSRRHSAPIKDSEYWAMGLPVIITKGIADDSDIICSENIGYVLQDLNREEYTKAMTEMKPLLQNPSLKKKIFDIAKRERSFSIADKVYRQVYG